jgi:hypothetical protein
MRKECGSERDGSTFGRRMLCACFLLILDGLKTKEDFRHGGVGPWNLDRLSTFLIFCCRLIGLLLRRSLFRGSIWQSVSFGGRGNRSISLLALRRSV